MRESYPNIPVRPSDDDVHGWVRFATRERATDLQDYNNLDSTRSRVYSAPSSSTDMRGTEKVGDVAADSSYFYVVVDNAGSLEWRRVAVSSF